MDYYLGPPSIPYIIIRLYTGDALRLYETGEIDIAGVSSYSVPRVTDPKESLSKDVVKGVSLCTSYIVFDTSQPPFDDLKVRQAFALAFDRDQYIKTVTNGISLPAKGLYPPGLPGYDPNFKGLDFDPTRAQQLLKESKYGSAAKLPPIVFTEGGFGTDVYPSTAALAQMWKTTLGVQINVENIEPNRYSTLLHSGVHGQIFTGGWCADYPDPENFADALFHTDASQNNGNYSNPALDTILEQARTERDVTKRMALYQQAEQMIVQDAPVIFTTHGLSYVLVKPYIKGYVDTPIDVPLERYLWLDWSGQDK
jgi:oligopeptide transport system substrate-binding protein